MYDLCSSETYRCGKKCPWQDVTPPGLLAALGIGGEDFVGIACGHDQGLLNPTHSQKHRLPERKSGPEARSGPPQGLQEQEDARAKGRNRAPEGALGPTSSQPGAPGRSRGSRDAKRHSDAGVRHVPRKRVQETTATPSAKTGRL